MKSIAWRHKQRCWLTTDGDVLSQRRHLENVSSWNRYPEETVFPRKSWKRKQKLECLKLEFRMFCFLFLRWLELLLNWVLNSDFELIFWADFEMFIGSIQAVNRLLTFAMIWIWFSHFRSHFFSKSRPTKEVHISRLISGEASSAYVARSIETRF